MNKKYDSIFEASLAVVKFEEDMAHMEIEIAFLKKQLESKQDFYDFLKQQKDIAENAVIDMEIDKYCDSLEESEEDCIDDFAEMF